MGTAAQLDQETQLRAPAQPAAATATAAATPAEPAETASSFLSGADCRRSDARRNRQKIVVAARLVFAEHGPDVHMEVLAKSAGVGIGTLYRHFPTKDALIGALAREWIEERTEDAIVTLEDPDVRAGMIDLIQRWAHAQDQHNGLGRIFGDLPCDQLCPEESARHTAVVEQVVVRARDAGVLRAGIDTTTLGAFCCGMSRAIEGGTPWELAAEVLAAGLLTTDQRVG